MKKIYKFSSININLPDNKIDKKDIIYYYIGYEIISIFATYDINNYQLLFI